MIEPALDVLLSPTLWLCVGLGMACGLLFHIWRGGGWRWLLADFLAGVVGFAVGQVAGTLLRVDRTDDRAGSDLAGHPRRGGVSPGHSTHRAGRDGAQSAGYCPEAARLSVREATQFPSCRIVCFVLHC